MKRLLFLIVLLAALPVSFTGQTADPSLLTLDRIFSSDEFRVRTFGPARWLDGGNRYTTVEASGSVDGAHDIVAYDTATGARAVLVSAEVLRPEGAARPLEIAGYEWAMGGRLALIFTNTRKVWRLNTRGDYWVLDLRSGALWRVGGRAPEASLMYANFSPDGSRISYVHRNDIFVQEVATRKITRLTHDGSDTRINGNFDWAYEEEFLLHDGTRWSPDSRRLAYWQIDASGVGIFHLINNTDSLYPTLTPIQYPKVGERISAARVGVVNATGGRTTWMQVPGDPRDHYIARMDWAGSSDAIAFQRLNRLQNTNAVRIGDPRSGRTHSVLVERDEAWLDVVDDLHWMDEGQRLTWLSERDGWRRVYVVPRDGGPPVGVTAPDHDVIDVVRVDRDYRTVDYLASPDNATQTYLYRAALDAPGRSSRLTPAGRPGTHEYDVSPDGRWAFLTWSAFGQPPVTELVALPEHRVERVLEDNAAVREKLQALQRGRSEFVTLDIGQGVSLDAWRMMPPGGSPGSKHPLLVYVYGEPAGQAVVDRWHPVYFWHLMLTQRGYVVASADNRGTPGPKGRAWRKIVYRQIGILASEEQAAAVRQMQGWPMVDAERIGVWGWSGGGSMTLNALFRYPDLYRVGLSVAPVSDQTLYDAIYQERYMGLPADNPDGYRDGSPITHAQHLRGDLLVVHGTGDDNVHYQSAERLFDALIAARKPFSMMAYPNRSHSLSEGEHTFWHLFDLLTRFLETHLPAKPGA